MNSYVIIGSQAMLHHYPDFPRVPHDTDIVISRDTYNQAIANRDDIEVLKENPNGWSSIVKFKGSGYIEYLIADGIESLEILLRCDTKAWNGYAPPEVLYSIRKAHIHFPIKFDKHIKDFMFLREKLRQERGISLEQDLGSQMDWLDECPEFTVIHFKCTEQRRGKLKTPKMKESKEQFFGKSKKYVTSYFVHDDMHKAIALMHEGDPVYQKILADGAEVETDSGLWNKLTIQQKIWCVLEEVYVIALERKIIPPLFEDKEGMSPKEAFDWALMRVCTTLCDGFFRDFAVRAYDEIQKQYNPDYVQLFFKNISQYDTNYGKTESETDQD
jgi:hypothetical protein